MPKPLVHIDPKVKSPPCGLLVFLSPNIQGRKRQYSPNISFLNKDNRPILISVVLVQKLVGLVLISVSINMAD